MQTTINRYDVHVFERLVSKLMRPSELPQTVPFAPCSEGLQFVAFGKDAVLRMTTHSEDTVEPFTLPWSATKQLASRKREPGEVQVEGDSVSVTYSLGGVPQHVTYPSPGLTENRLPPKPDNIVAHDISILDALCDAGKCVDSDNSRYSLGAICLRAAKSQIITTDGRQALMQEGYTFPWSDDVLCPVSKIFASKELRELSDAVHVGYENDWLYFEIGNVAIWLKSVEGKFPQMDQFTKRIDHFTWLDLDPVDSNFVAQRLENLPGKSERESPIYIELNGHLSVRGHDQSQLSATELLLARSRYEGKPVAMAMNRRFLKNALDFGINRIGFDPDERTPVVGYGNRKTFVIMPLEGDEPKVDKEKLTVLNSDAKISVPAKVDRPRQRVKPIEKPVAAPSVCREIKSSDTPKSKAAILEEAEKLRQTLRDSLDGVNGLIREIKAQRRQDKLLRDTVASLQKLQNV